MPTMKSSMTTRSNRFRYQKGRAVVRALFIAQGIGYNKKDKKLTADRLETGSCPFFWEAMSERSI